MTRCGEFKKNFFTLEFEWPDKGISSESSSLSLEIVFTHFFAWFCLSLLIQFIVVGMLVCWTLVIVTCMSKLKTVHCAMLYFQCVLDHCYLKGQFLTVWVDVNSVLCERHKVPLQSCFQVTGIIYAIMHTIVWSKIQNVEKTFLKS